MALGMRDYQNLKIWEESYQFTLEIYKLTKKFPQEELYTLAQQIRRSAHSINSNIAEGAGRGSNKDFLRFLYNASGSLSETKNHIQLAKDLNYISIREFSALNSKIAKIGGMLNIFIQKLIADCRQPKANSKHVTPVMQ